FAILNLAIFALGINPVLVDALHAVCAFFHDPAAAHGHVGIAHHLVLRSFPVLEEEEIEAPHLVGTVVGAIACAHAAVVHHVIQTFAAVHRRTNRADHFAGSVLALLAGHRLEVGLGIGAVTLEISIHAQPVHVPPEHSLLLADDGDIVLRLASDNAVVAAHAGIHVDGHAPGVRLGRVGIRLVQGQFLRRLFFACKLWLLAVLLDTRSTHQRAGAGGRFHSLVALGGG